MTTTARSTLAAAILVAVFVAFGVGDGSIWKYAFGAVGAGVIFYLLYGLLDKNPAADEEDRHHEDLST